MPTISCVACNNAYTYFIRRLDHEALPNHAYYDVLVEATGDDAGIAQVRPLVDAQLSQSVDDTVLLTLNNVTLDLSGTDTGAGIAETLTEAWGRRRATVGSGLPSPRSILLPSPAWPSSYMARTPLQARAS